MPTTIREQNIEFIFSDDWIVKKYDNDPDSGPFVGVVENRKATDFVGMHADVAFLIEVKDYRGFRIQNKPKTSGELHTAIAQKVHDTLSGLILTHRRQPATPLWRDALRACRQSVGDVRVVVWLEDDALFDTTKPNGKAAAAIFVTALKNRLRWFPGRVFVVNRDFNSGALPDVTARDLPGAAGHGGANVRNIGK